MATEQRSEDVVSRFEEGKPADPTENMSPEDAKKWREEHQKNKDRFKEAAERVVARFQGRTGRWDDWDGKFMGRDARLRWSRTTWLLEELPQKGKKKLKVADLMNPSSRGMGEFDPFIASNILRDAKLSSSDNYERIKKKILDAYEKAADRCVEKGVSEENVEWLRKEDWHERTEFYLNIVPEDVDPIEVEGKDFSFMSKWTGFKAYSPSSDFQQADPHYTYYGSTSPTAARKLYKIVNADPTVLKNVSWSKFDEWLKKNKIGYDTHFSVWR